MTIRLTHTGKLLSNGASQIALLTLRIQQKKQLDSQSNLSYNTANGNPPLPARLSRAGEDIFDHNDDYKWNRKHGNNGEKRAYNYTHILLALRRFAIESQIHV